MFGFFVFFDFHCMARSSHECSPLLFVVLILCKCQVLQAVDYASDDVEIITDELAVGHNDLSHKSILDHEVVRTLNLRV